MRLIDWQYYPKWRLSYAKTQNSFNDWAWSEHWVSAGPFQFRFGSKPWLTHLRRSPEYSEKIKRVLLEDLKTL